ncbi:G5 domain-containing protein [Streptococcus mitis]|uniref:G5 domain-containing protein n=1 Tax=Streptococcus mitis TaxID=28037 RepID=UPI0020008AB9|nr:G5 domain-containing protein [Streptococcus mitis]
MRKWKQGCSVILGLTVLGFANLVEVVTPFIETTRVYAQENSNVNGNTLTFTAKSREEIIHTTEKKIKPMDLLVVLDFSGSNTDNITKMFSDLKSLVSTMSDEDQIWLFSYDFNLPDSYKAKRSEIASGKPMNKKNLIKLLENKQPDANVFRIINEFKDLFKKEGWDVTEDSIKKGFSEIYDNYSGKKNSYVSTIQFTDGWDYGEKIDIQYANWAKNHAKTFYTVTYNANERSYSVEAMKAVGHNNIFISDASTTELERQKAINDQFAKTAIEEIKEEKVSVKQKGTVSISPEADLTLTSAELVAPNGQKTPLTITNNTVSWSGDLDNGSYTVNYTFTGTPSVERSIRSSVTVDGKKVDEKINTLRPEKIAFETKYEEDSSLAAGQEKEKQAGSEGSQLLSLKDGKVISTTITKPKVDRIVLRGSKSAVATKELDYKTTYVEDKESEAGKKTVVTKGSKGHETSTVTHSFNAETGEVTANEPKVEKTESVDEVISMGTKPVVTTKELDYKTKYVEDKDSEAGKKTVVTKGSKGHETTTITYSFNSETGEVTANEPKVEKTESVDEVISVGTKPKVEIRETEFKTEKRENKDLKKGEEKIIQAGVKGRETITTTYYLDPETGDVKENKPSLEKVDPVNEIIEVGTQAEKVLPNTGTSLSNFLTLTGIIGIALGISVITYRKLKKK